jgi:hypothetical protein
MRFEAWRARLEVTGLVALAATAVFFIATSWRRWCDPLIDFGQQLYNAWQLSTGAVLYRDVGCLYGPLSQYFNAGIFYIFGPGLIVIAIANLTIFGAISIGIYILFRRAWGGLAAWVSTLIFISVFGFSHFVDLGNYNYAAPYAHETTHGVLICLLLCFALIGWIENPTAVRSFFAGLLFGATIVIKPEFIFTALALTCVAALAYWKYRGLPKVRLLFYWLTAAALPTALFTLYFARFMPWSGALSAASQAWLNVLNRSFNSSPLAIRLLGFDQPRSRFFDETVAILLAFAVISALAVAVIIAERKLPRWLLLSGGVILTSVFVWLGCFAIKWIEIGRCLFGLTLTYFLVSIVSFLWQPKSEHTATAFRIRVLRVLIAGLGVTLMARMFLNPSIYHYGYYQAAVAAMLVPAVMIGELPTWFGRSWRGRSLAAAATLALVLPGIVNLTKRSQYRYQLKTLAIGAGRDRFYCLPERIDPLGEIIGLLTDALREKGRGETLTVLPEGEFINYLARLRNPLPHPCFYIGAMETASDAEMVSELKAHSPNWVAIISRDLGGWGIERYGDKPGGGQEILQWVEHNYKQVVSMGGDPLDYRERGAILLRKYSR